MQASPETYKGIEFVRISSLPVKQRKLILNSFEAHHVHKILCGEHLLTDCLMYNDYQTWYFEKYKAFLSAEARPSLDMPQEEVLLFV